MNSTSTRVPVRAATATTVQEGVGLVKVRMFPSIVGIDFARELDRAIAEFSVCAHLVVDLRGNVGGGVGALRLMSSLLRKSAGRVA